VIAAVQLPDSAALWRTQATLAQAEQIARQVPRRGAHHRHRRHVVRAAGLRLQPRTMFITLDPFEKRQTPELSADGIMAKPCARRGSRMSRMGW